MKSEMGKDVTLQVVDDVTSKVAKACHEYLKREWFGEGINIEA